MATRNLVPRTGSQGQIGTVSKPWKQAIFDTGSFQVIKGHLTPDAKETYDLGTAAKPWREIYVSTSSINFVNPTTDTVIQTMTATSDGFSFGSKGDAIVSGSTISGSKLHIVGTAFIGGDLTLGDADTDSISISADLTSNLIPNADGTYDLGSTSKGWNDLHLGSGGVINLDGGDVTLTHSSGKVTWGGDGAVEIDFNNHEMTNVDINSGAIDGTTIGAASPAAGTFLGIVGTTLSATGDIDLGNATSDTITATGRFDSDIVPSSDSTRDLGTSTLQFAEAHIDTGYIDAITVTGTSTLTTVDINGGAVDATIIGANTAAAGTFTNLQVTTDVNIDDSGGDGAMDGVIIGAAAAAAGTFTTLNTTGLTTIGDASGDTLTINAATINPANIAAGTDNTVVVYNGSTLLTDEIDSRVWGTTLVDTDGSGANNELATWSDTDSIIGEGNLTFDGSILTVTGNAVVSSHISASGDISGSAASTGSFGRLQLASDGGMDIPDSVRLNLGDGQDLKLYHSGDHSIIQDTGTGDLQLKGSIIKIRGTSTGENMGVFTENAAVDLYYNGNKKFETTNTGVNITGAVTASTIDIDSIQGNWTNAGNTVADLGSITTVDINGGTINGIQDLAVVDGGTGASTLNDLITMGTHTTGNYVATLTAGALIDLQNNSGETASPTIDVDLSEAAEAAIADGDYVLFLDGGATGTQKKEALHDVATLFSGTGLTAASSVIGVDASQTQITAVGTIGTGVWQGTTVAVDQGGTGATTLNNLITLGTHSSGNYVATVADSGGGGITVANSGAESAAVTLELDIHGLTTDAIASGDFIAFADEGEAGDPANKETIDDVATLFAGTGLTAASAVLGVDAAQTQITSIGTIGTGVWQGTVINDDYIDTINNSNKVALTALDIDGGTDIGAAIVDADLIILDDGAGGTNRKATMSRLKTYMSGISGGSTLGNIQVGVTATGEIDTSSGNLTIDSAGGTTTIDDAVTITGNLTVNGETTYVSSSAVSIGDRIVVLNAGNAPGDGGLYIIDTDTTETGSLLWDVSADRWIGGLKDAEVTIPTISSTDTLTNKSIDLDSNTLSGTTAEFNTALQGDSFATLTNSVTLTNKTLTTPTIGSFTNATHNHTNAAGGGQIALATAASDNYVATAVAGTGISVSGATGNVTITSAITAGDGLTLNTADIDIDAAQTTITSILATDLKIGEDDQTKIDFETADTINFYAGNEKQLILTDGALTPGADNIIDLGASDNEFKNAYFDGTVTSDAFAGPLTGAVTGNADTATKISSITNSNIVQLTSSQTLTNKTLTSPDINGGTISAFTIDGNWTAASQTCADLGSVTTMDINGGDIASGVTINKSPVITLAGDLGGSVTLSALASGTLTATIQATSVEGSMLNTNVISGQTAMTGDVVDADELLVSDAGTIKRADFSVVRDAVFNDVSGDATIADGGALTIASTSVDNGMLAGSIANAKLSNSSLTYTAGTGLTGGGAVSLGGSATLNVIGGNGITANADDMMVTAAQTTITSIINNGLKIGGYSSHQLIDFSADDMIKVSVNNVADEFRFATGGTFHADADVVAYSSTTASDVSLKKNITDTKYGLSDIMKLRGVDYDWKREDMGHDVGVLAHEVEAVIPEIVKEYDGLKGRGKFKAVDYNKLVPVLIESIKTLKTELEDLKKKVN